MPVHILYATTSGCSQEIAEHCHATCRGHGVDSTLANVATNPAPGHCPTLLISGIRATTIHSSMRTWIAQHATELAGHPLAVVRVGLNPKTPALADFLAAHDLRAGRDEFFMGLYEPERFRLPERMMMKAFGQKEGDFRDFPRLTAFMESLLDQWGLRAPRHTP